MASTAEAPALPGQSAVFYEALRYGSWPLLRGLFRLETHGAQNVPAHGGVVLASLHRSNWDTFAVLVPLRHRRGRAMAKVELYRNRLLGRILLAGGAFPVRRNENDTEAIAAAIGLLRAGEMLMMYPEGTRNRDGRARVHTGAARLALEAGAALVPCAVAGTEELRGRGLRRPHFRVAYGPPIRVDDLPADDLRRAAYGATERWKEAVADLRATLG